jgi:hypothetical protein
MAETDIHPLPTSVANDTKVSSYNKHIGSKLGDPARRLLETYSKISSDEIEKHVYAIVCPLPPFHRHAHENVQRDEAWEVWPYRCIGQFRFLDLSISHYPHYPAILERLKKGDQNFLDLGCCFGQDLC